MKNVELNFNKEFQRYEVVFNYFEEGKQTVTYITLDLINKDPQYLVDTLQEIFARMD